MAKVGAPPGIRDVLEDFEAAHVYAFQLTFALMGLVAIFSRRSRWTWASPDRGGGLTRKPHERRAE